MNGPILTLKEELALVLVGLQQISIRASRPARGFRIPVALVAKTTGIDVALVGRRIKKLRLQTLKSAGISFVIIPADMDFERQLLPLSGMGKTWAADVPEALLTEAREWLKKLEREIIVPIEEVDMDQLDKAQVEYIMTAWDQLMSEVKPDPRTGELRYTRDWFFNEYAKRQPKIVKEVMRRRGLLEEKELEEDARPDSEDFSGSTQEAEDESVPGGNDFDEVGQ